MNIIKLTVITLSVLVLTACARIDSFNDLQLFVEEVKSRPGEDVEPIPTFEEYEAFTYSAAGLRAPFDIPVVTLHTDADRLNRNVEPDFERLREALEEHAISDLLMVGMLQRKDVYVGLVEDGVGRVHRVMLGNYLGRNHGKVIAITDTQLDLIEIVPNGDGGWVERPQTLELIR